MRSSRSIIAGRRLAHGLYRRLVGQKIAAINRVVKVLPGGVAFALHILGGVDSALRANRVRSLHRHNGKQIDVAARFGDLNGSSQSRQPAAHYDDSRIICHALCLKIKIKIEPQSIAQNYTEVKPQRKLVPLWHFLCATPCSRGSRSLPAPYQYLPQLLCHSNRFQSPWHQQDQ